MRSIFLLVVVGFILFPNINTIYAVAPLNECNTFGECRAKIISVYISGGAAYIQLENSLIHPICTQAPWGHYWTIALSGDDITAKEKYSLALTAYISHEIVEVRTFTDRCNIFALGLGALD